MTPPSRDDAGPVLRFLRACEGLARFWAWSAAAGLLVVVLGITPSLLAAVAVMGVIWMPILVLVFWGRMLDETMHMRSDEEDGPR